MGGGVDEALEWLRLAREALGAATTLLETGFFRDVVSKAYYAMFYSAKAAIVSEGLQATKHSTVISMFGLHFVKTGRVARDLHQALRTAFDERQLADYSLDWQPDREAAESRLAQAQQFVEEVARLLKAGDYRA